jgi:hypothetical protein
LAEGGDFELGPITTLQYQQDGRTAVLTITALLGDQVTVAVVVQ